MDDLIVKNVDMFGDRVVAAQDGNRMIWAGVKWLCDGIGLSEGQRKRQLLKIQGDIVLNKGVTNLVLPTNGGQQKVLCMGLDLFLCGLLKLPSHLKCKRNLIISI